MSYLADSFVAGETPTTAKWNKLWSNDASFNDGTGIANFSKSVTAISNPYKFRAWQNGAASTTATVFTKVPLDTEDYDTNSNFTGGTYTAPVAGFYKFDARASMSSSSSALMTALYKNGSIVTRGAFNRANADITGSTLSDLIQLAAGDTIELYVFSNSTVSLEVGAKVFCYLAGYLESRT